jgi:hypothetical protein
MAESAEAARDGGAFPARGLYLFLYIGKYPSDSHHHVVLPLATIHMAVQLL